MPSRILIIDDEHNWREQFRDVIITMGFEADVARESKEAAALLQIRKYSLIILDVTLDESSFTLSCQQFCDFLVRHYPDLPVVATTGKSLSPPEVFAIAKLGVANFIFKPQILLSDLKSIIQSSLGEPIIARTSMSGNLISSENPGISQYDVFLSHCSQDKRAIEILAKRLEDEENLKPFLDKWYLVPGEAWQEALETALNKSATCAVFLGPSGFGPWENEEMRSALVKRVRNRNFRVIPVFLPGASSDASYNTPPFLERLTWIKFCSGLEDSEAFRRLVAGIRGIAPGRSGD